MTDGVTIVAGVVAVVVCVTGLLVNLLRMGPLVVEDETMVVDVGLAALGRLVVVAEGLLDFRAVVDLTSKVVSSLCWNTISWRLGNSSKLCCGVGSPSSSHRQISIELNANTNGSRNRSRILQLFLLLCCDYESRLRKDDARNV